MYVIGDPEKPLSEARGDYKSVEEAENAAVQESLDDHVWAVIDKQSGEIVSIIFQQRVYS